jgi:uncharacterized membrane protein YbhN (UPF0104 family)
VRTPTPSGEPAALRPGGRWARALAALRVAVTLALLTALFFLFGLSPGNLLDAVSGADASELALAFAAILALLLLLSLKWYVVARGLSVPVSFAAATRLYLTGMILNNLLPTAIGGDAYRVYSLSRRSDVGFKRPFASVVIERGSGYAGLLVLSAPAAAFYFLGALAGLATSAALLAAFAVAYIALRRLGSAKATNDNEAGGWSWRRLPLAPATIYLVAVLSVVQQAVWISTAALFGLAYDVSVPWTYWALTVTAITLLTLASLSVGGLGLREVGYVALLKPLDVDAGHAAAVGLAMGFAPSLLSLPLLLPFAASASRSQEPAPAPTDVPAR